MKPNELTVDQVISELNTLIMEYPDRNGHVYIGQDYDGNDDYSCVYYTNGDGVPINTDNFDHSNENEPELKTPVCLIGQWIEDFHPEFKEDSYIRTTLLANSSFGAMDPYSGPFQESVWQVLNNAQMAQDSFNTLWGDIRIDR